MNPSLVFSSFISQSLSPAVAISAIGLLTLGAQNRIIMLGARTRQLNREKRRTLTLEQRANLAQQIELFHKRVRVVRNAMFLFYAALGLMVFTAIAIAMTQLGVFDARHNVPVFSFLTGLVLVFTAVMVEAYEVMLNQRTLDLDIHYPPASSGPEDHPVPEPEEE